MWMAVVVMATVVLTGVRGAVVLMMPVNIS
jgi:hypothetical protein